MDDLSLQDIHLPEPVSGWPLAPGWWCVLIGVPLLLAACVYCYQRLTRKTAVKTARRQLQSLRLHPQDDALQTLTHLSALLKRVAISTAPRNEVASLTGKDWLAYLDGPFKDAPFSQGVGRCLADAAYRQTAPDEIDFQALFDLCEQWLKRQSKR